MLAQNVVVFDIETTGLSKYDNEIIEIGAIKVSLDDMDNFTSYNTFVKPSCSLPQEIVDLTGITDEMLEDGINLEQAVKEFYDFVGTLPLVAHNASFDCGFMSQAYRSFGLDFHHQVIDTLSLAKDTFALPNYKLGTLAKILQIPTDGEAHRAINDALVTAKLYKVLAES